jgi:hypothetical protein
MLFAQLGQEDRAEQTSVRYRYIAPLGTAVFDSFCQQGVTGRELNNAVVQPTLSRSGEDQNILG